MCGHITTHYMYIQDMLRTVLAFKSPHYVRTSQQCFIVPISKPEEKLRKIKIHMSTMKPH